MGRVVCEKRDGCGVEVPVKLQIERESFQEFETVEFGETITVEETLFVSWYVTNGDFENSRAAPSEPCGAFENTWHPEAPGTHTLYVVAHDTRGGASWQTFTVEVRAP